MIINSYKEFLNIISKNKKGVFLICGEEKYLIRKSINDLYNLITSYKEMNLIKLQEKDINVDCILNSCETLPFFSDIKLVHIKNPSFLKKSKKDSVSENMDISDSKDVPSFLSKYILNLSESVILLISCEDDIELNNKLVTSIKNVGYLVQYKALKPKELEDVALNMFKERGKEIKKAELSYLVSDISSIDELEVEIEKICAFALDEKIITKEHIDSVTYKGIESNVFKLVDAIVRKNADKAMSILNALLFQGENHLIILAMIIRQYRLIYNVKRYLIQNKDKGEIKKVLNIKNDMILNNLINQSSNMNFDELKNSFKICLETDYDIKRSRMSSNMALEMLIVNLCK